MLCCASGSAPQRRAPAAGTPARPTEVIIDGDGIPHIYGERVADVVFGLGFMHARDRAPQLAVLRLAGGARLAEAFGADYLTTDRQLRLGLIGLEDEIAALDPDDRDLLHAYVEGLNQGHRQARGGGWHQAWALDEAPFTARDVMGIARVQAWLAADNLRSELARLHIAARLADDDPRRALWLAEVPSGGVATLAPAYLRPLSPAPRPPLPPASDDEPAPADNIRVGWALSSGPAFPGWAPGPPPPAVPLLGWPDGLPGQGQSSAWVIHGQHRAGGASLLVNDPHGPHGDLSQLYLAHLETPAFSAIGATLPGLPILRIAATPHLAYGVTAARVDTQDLIPVEPGEKLLALPQTFRVRGGASRRETYHRARAGPLVPADWLPPLPVERRYALRWSGFDAQRHRQPFSPYFRLAAARSLAEADAALLDLAAPTQSMLLAMRDGAIAYRLVGLVPRRAGPSAEEGVASGDARETAFLDESEKPRADNPPSGYLVAANQRIVPEGDPLADWLGGDADLPYRAQRIHERLRELLYKAQTDARALSDVQQDVVSVQARTLAPILGERCPERAPPHDDALVAAFCRALRDFDGAYREESPGALPFTLLHEALMRLIVGAHLGPELWPMLRLEPFVEGAIDAAIAAEAQGAPSPLLDLPRTRAREGLRGMVAIALGHALEELPARDGTSPEHWRWGRARGFPGGGFRHAPRAESDAPTPRGAILRFVAEGGPHMRVAATLDRGQTGDPAPMPDRRSAWATGDLPTLLLERAEVDARARERLRLTR